MTRFWKRFAFGVVLLASFLGVLSWLILTYVLIRPANYQPERLQTLELRSWPEHDAIYQSADFPYVFSVKAKEGELMYVGALHTSDAEAQQLKVIEKRWQEFRPTVAFCEGRKRMFRFSSRARTGRLSESDLVRILAYRNGVKLFTLEPAYEDEVAGLLNHFDPKLVATYMTIRVFSSEASSVPESEHDGLASQLLQKRTNVDGLRQVFSTIKELDQYWREAFPDEPDWRKLENGEQVVKLREVGDVSRELRGQHMVSSIAELVKNGEKVFAVVGASHVIRQELELRRLLAD